MGTSACKVAEDPPTPPPSYLQFTPDKACPGNSPVVHARKTHMCPPGPASRSPDHRTGKQSSQKQKCPACIFTCLLPTHHIVDVVQQIRTTFSCSVCSAPAHGRTKSARGRFDFGAPRRKCLDASVMCKCVQVGARVCIVQGYASVCKCGQACGSVQAWCAKREWSQNAPRCTFVWTSQKRRKMHVE